MEHLNPLVMDLGQLAVVVSIVWTITRSNTKKIDVLETECAVMKDRTSNSKEDHDRLVLAEAAVKAAHARLDEIKAERRQR